MDNLTKILSKRLKAEKIDYKKPVKLDSSDPYELFVMPEYEYLRDNIAMSKITYDRTFGVWKNLER